MTLLNLVFTAVQGAGISTGLRKQWPALTKVTGQYFRTSHEVAVEVDFSVSGQLNLTIGGFLATVL